MTDNNLEDLVTREEQAQIRVLEILREFSPPQAFVILAAACASTLLHVPPDARKHFRRDFPIAVERLLKLPHQVMRDQLGE
jgi:hypothetical protein